MTETSQPRTDAAIEVTDREIEYATAERDAFRAFRSRLERVDPAAASAALVGHTGEAGVALAGGDRPTDSACRAVETAYRETVMAVPHFEREYGDTLRECLAAEFSASIAASVTGSRPLTETHLGALAAAADRAVRERGEFLRALRRERDSLRDVRETLDRCERAAVEAARAIDGTQSSDRLSRLDDRLATLEAECDAVAASRQQLVHGRSTSTLSGIDGTSFAVFLYGDHETTCPALADVADCCSTIRHQRRRCLR